MLLGILTIEIGDQLGFEGHNFRDAAFCGVPFLLVCLVVGHGFDSWLRWRFSPRMVPVERRTQLSISTILWSTALVAVACSVLNFAAAQDLVDWFWIGQFLVVHLLVIIVASFSCSKWRHTFAQSQAFTTQNRRLSLFVIVITFFFAIASAAVTAKLGERYLSPWRSFFASDFSLWYTLGFTVLFSILLYRTLPRRSQAAAKL
jgi:hypothetical protein